MKRAMSLALAAVAWAGCSKQAPEAPRAPVVAAAPTSGATAAAGANAAASAAPLARTDAPPAGIAWRQAASDADVDAAFALARAQRQPVFVYWGARWCPPCNQLKATLFNRVDFIERTRAYVPVYVDGDSPGAQRLGTRFKVRGYPTLVLFDASGAEITRLPGEADAAQVTQLMTLGMAARRPVKAVLADARQGGAQLTPAEWKLLAFYAWETDEQQLVPRAQLPAVVRQLAAACPPDQGDAAARLWLKSAALAEDHHGAPDAATRTRLLQWLADPATSRALADVLTNQAADIVRAVSTPHSAARAQLGAAYDQAMQRLQADTSLSRADRLTALDARVDLARIDRPVVGAKAKGKAKGKAKAPLPASLVAEVREQAARMDREITDGYERQAVITEAAYLLAQVGLLDDSDALLKANLARSHSPYYLMSELAANAKKRGDAAGVLRWSREAFERAEGPSTRLQWGAAHVAALVEWAPADEARIQAVVHQLLEEAAAQPDAFHERSARSLQRVGGQLLAWNQHGRHQAVLQRLRAELDAVCAKLPADDATQRAACRDVFSPAAKSAA
jgi:thioredoxin-like negative regulator of GroEL